MASPTVSKILSASSWSLGGDIEPWKESDAVLPADSVPTSGIRFTEYVLDRQQGVCSCVRIKHILEADICLDLKRHSPVTFRNWVLRYNNTIWDDDNSAHIVPHLVDLA